MNLPDDRLAVLIRHTGIGLVGRVIGRSLFILQSLIVARMFGPSIFGLYSIGLTLFRSIEILVPLGMDIGVVRFGAEFTLLKKMNLVKGVVVGSVVLSGIFSILLALLIFNYSTAIALNVYQKSELIIIFRFFAVIIPFSTLLLIFSAILRMQGKVLFSTLAQDIAQPLVAIIFLISSSFIVIKLELVFIADIISYFVAVLICIYFLLKFSALSSITFEDVKYPGLQYYIYSIMSAGSIFLSTIALWVDRIFSGYYLASEDVGVYQACLQISALFAVVLGSLNRIILPYFSFLYAGGKQQELQEVFRISTKWNLYLSSPIILFLLINSPTVLGFVYGERYELGGLALVILLVGQFVNLATGAVGPLLLVGGMQKQVLVLSIIALIANSILCVLLIPNFGIAGAAVANSLSTICLYLCGLVFIRHVMKLWPYDAGFLKGGVAALFTIAILSTIKWLMKDMYLLPGLILQFFISFVCFGGLLYYLGLEKEDRAFLSLIKNKLAELFV